LLGVVILTTPIFGDNYNNQRRDDRRRSSQIQERQRRDRDYSNRQQAFLFTPQEQSQSPKKAQNRNAPNNINKPMSNSVTPAVEKTEIESREWEKQSDKLKETNHPSSYMNREHKTVLEMAKQTPNLSIFVEAVKASGLDEQLANDGPYTIFAPSNKAFKQLPAGSLERLMKPENQRQLYAIISYHIVPGKIASKDAKASKIKTVNGKNLDLVINRGHLTVDDAEVIRQDIPGSNGVIHVIDEVVLPN
ncbi:fasciclin domain-containing protein, partial [Chlamydiales bacterium]|nr:fasciclin domain-containing protein [Chlamydiales bacterium]